MVLDAETTEDIGNDEQAKVKSEVALTLTPEQPYSETNLVVTNINYEARQLPQLYEKAPVFDVNDAGWLTTASYDLDARKNGLRIALETISINYQEPKVIYLNTPEGIITVNNLGILPQGVEVPSGDLIIVYDPDGNKHVWDKADLIKMIDDWNSGRTFIRVSFIYYGWDFVWDRTEERGWLPQDVQLVHISKVEYTLGMTRITLIYSGIAFAGLISIYVPETMADTIIIQLMAPKPTITSVTPDPLPTIEEGKKTVFEVSVKNEGTEGTVSIASSSESYSFNPLTATSINMEVEETFTFKFEAFALNVFEDKDTTTKIFVQGRGGSDTYNLLGQITNVEGYTPPIPDPTQTSLIIYLRDENYSPISEITVSITYGASTETELSNPDGDVFFDDLGQYTGPVKIITQETAGYPSKTEIITVELGTNEHTILFGVLTDWMQYLPWVIAIVAIGGALGFFGISRKKRRKRKL